MGKTSFEEIARLWEDGPLFKLGAILFFAGIFWWVLSFFFFKAMMDPTHVSTDLLLWSVIPWAILFIRAALGAEIYASLWVLASVLLLIKVRNREDFFKKIAYFIFISIIFAVIVYYLFASLFQVVGQLIEAMAFIALFVGPILLFLKMFFLDKKK